MAYLIDTTDHLVIDQLSKRPLHWRTVADPTLVLGFLTHPVWCRFTLLPVSETPQEFALELTNFYVDSLTLYQPRGAGGWQVQYTGDLLPFARRYPKTRNPTFYVTLSGTTPQTFYARISLNQHHNYKWQLWRKQVFDAQRLPDLDRYITVAVALMLLLFTLALLVFMYRIAVLRAYGLWGITFCLSVLFGYGNQNAYFPQSPYWAHVSYYASVGLLLPGFSYYVVQACRLPQVLPRLVGLYIGFGVVGLVYAGLSFVYRHAYVTWALIATLTILLGFTFALVVALLLSGNRPAIWNVLIILMLSPIYTYFYGRNAGFFSGFIGEDVLKFMTFLSIVADPFFFVMILWQATRERIQIADRLNLEQTQRASLLALDRLKTHFFTNVSHELRTPLTLLLGPVKTLLTDSHLSAKQTALLQLALRSGQQLEQLVNDILDLSKLEAGKLDVTTRPTALAHFFRHKLSLFEVLAQRRHLHLQVDNRLPETVMAQLDQIKCRQILNNLLANAVKFTAPGGQITVTLALAEGQLHLSVADTGPGIHPDDLPHLFERYFQTNRPDKSAQCGSGIGLALCQEYVQLMGGSIHVESTLGQGSVFRVVLPLGELEDLPSPVRYDTPTMVDSTADSQARSLTTWAPPDGPPTDRPRLLVVDDNADLQAYLGLLLGDHYTLVMAHNGQHALAQLAACETGPSGISLVLTDLMMPVMNGQQLLKQLKAEDATRHLPVIVLTARTSSRDKLQALRVGVDDYLLKPFEETELLARIENLLTNQAVRRQALIELSSSMLPDLPPVVDQAASAPRSPLVSQADQHWLEAFEQYIQQQLANPTLSVAEIAYHFAMSESTLLRQLKRLTGLSPHQYVQAVRLETARSLLESGQGYSVGQVASLVGYGDVRSFRRTFRSRFGRLPSDVLAN